jgi:hypothetical protein
MKYQQYGLIPFITIRTIASFSGFFDKMTLVFERFEVINGQRIHGRTFL